MVTGGGGSIGSEICRQIVSFEPRRLIILDVHENNAYNIQSELRKLYPNLDLDVIIASVRDRKNIFRIIEGERPDVIFHAAAHKHVPLMERSPKEAIKNNTFGTLNMGEAASKYGVKYFVLISTDKAVNPTNVMGTSKRMCEMVIQGLSQTKTDTKFAAVRFGNVLGSNGSVIPLFKDQIKEGGPVTVTHKDIIRYFMTIPEAAQLVIQAGAIAKGGEIFVLDMGEPVRIYDLALDLIRLSGLKPFEDIDIELVGLRPGEKLFEELLMEDEGLTNTEFKKIYIGAPSQIDYKTLKKDFIRLQKVIDQGTDCDLVELLRQLVPTFRTSEEVNCEVNLMSEHNGKYRDAK
jgi:FlaA1/EpsC-like NDP-sugar epimerase